MQSLRPLLLTIAAVSFALPAQAQSPVPRDTANAQPITIQYFRPQDKRGINIFETSKIAGAKYDGFKIQWGAAFTQQFQSLSHENDADSIATAPPGNNVNRNRLKDIGSGFNNAVANLYMHAQLAPGMRLQLTTYLSSRHHNETWVKDGFLQVDESPFDVALLNSIMKYTTLKIGHFQVNYGDMQFRRTDNGQAIYNPLVGEAIMDAFNTEVGTEVIVQRNGFIGMIAATNGEIRGRVDVPDDRSIAVYAKLGFDRQINDDLRVRLTASSRTQSSAASNSIYGGDRAGSRYYQVLENTAATEAAQFTSGRINPGMRDNSTSLMINPFIKLRGLEFFGLYETAKGKAQTETVDREVSQMMAEGVYRFMANEKMYVAARWNEFTGDLGVSGTGPTLLDNSDVTVTRTQIGGGWFLTPTLLLKAEYVNQEYEGFGRRDIRSNGKFKGFMLEGVMAF